MTLSKNKLTVSIIIPAFNNLDLLKSNLPAVVRARNNVQNNIVEIIIVDDGSTDSSYDFLKLQFKDVSVIKHKVNRGFAASVNTGARMAKGNLLALINTDVVPSNDFLVHVFHHFQDDKVFAVSMHENGFGWAKGLFSNGFIVHSPGDESHMSRQTFWVSGGTGVFRRDIWMRLGGMDEKLLNPFYWEDIDISYRALKRGYSLIWEPLARVLHKHEGTTGGINKIYKSRIQERNQLIFIWKNLTSANLMRKHVTGLLLRVSKHPGYTIIVFMALSKINHILKARKREIKETKVSDEAIFAKYV